MGKPFHVGIGRASVYRMLGLDYPLSRSLRCLVANDRNLMGRSVCCIGLRKTACGKLR
jgi:hypothetical protein